MAINSTLLIATPKSGHDRQLFPYGQQLFCIVSSVVKSTCIHDDDQQWKAEINHVIANLHELFCNGYIG